MVEKRFEKLGMPDIERFENYLPTAFNSELTLLQKVNKIIFDLMATNKLTNEMVEYLNRFIETFDEKLYETLEDVLNVWLEDGRLADIVRVAISEEVIEARTDYLGKKYVDLKERLDSEKADVVEVTAQLARTANDVVALFHKAIGYTTLEFEGAEEGEDNADAFDRAVDSFGGKPGKIIFSGEKIYYFSRTVYRPHNISLDLGLSVISPMVGGQYKNGFMFYDNVNTNGETIEKWGGEYLATISRGRFINDVGLTEIKGIYSRSKVNIEDITFDRFSKGYLKDGKSDADYSDMISLKKLYFINCLGSEPLIDIRYNGDGLSVDTCHVAGRASTNHNLLFLSSCNGGRIVNCINGDITIQGSSAIVLATFHCEHGKIKATDSTVTFENIAHWWNRSYQPVPLTIQNCEYMIENYIVGYVQKGVGIGSDLLENYSASDSIDAVIKNSTGKIVNFYRRYHTNVGNNIGMKTAAKISTDGVFANPDWEKNSALFSKECNAINKTFHSNIKEIIFDENLISYNVAITNHGYFEEAPGTYYYRAVFYYGPLDRKVGRFGGNEVSVTVKDRLDFPLVNIGKNPKTELSKVRVYRGKSSGNYSHFVDIPIGRGLSIYDCGFFISTGERWRNRGWTGSIDGYNQFFTKMKLDGTNVKVVGDRLPMEGEWTQGDVVVVSNEQGTQEEHECTKSGDFSGTAPIFRQRMWK